MSSPPLTERLRNGKPFLAPFSIIPSMEIVELVAAAGFDGVVLDTEHGAHGNEALAPLILAARANGIYPVVRVRSSDPGWIGASLDAGAAGIIVPQIGSAAEADRAVRAARFAPDGNRGANPFVRAAGYDGRKEWYAQANREIAVLLMIEGASGVAALAEILETPNLDGIFIGPNDLSHSLGVPGEVAHPKVVETIEAIIAVCRAKGMSCGIFSATPDNARHWIDRGVTFVGLGVDTALVLKAMRGAVDGVRG
jgi:4-hydroxy-2-oxoheptanedioate aldolase